MKPTARAILSLIPITLLVASLGCDRKIGPPNDQEELMRPENVASFDRLYKQNCSACHGENGSGGPALEAVSLYRYRLTCPLQACVPAGITRTTVWQTCLPILHPQ